MNNVGVIYIIPDTNVFLSNLDILKNIVKIKSKLKVCILVSSVILDELDNKKKRLVKAREAIRFIEILTKQKKLMIHNEFSEENINIQYTSETKYLEDQSNNLKGGNNDEKILAVALHYHRCVVLTNDKVLNLKAEKASINCILIGEMTNDEFILKFTNFFKKKPLEDIYLNLRENIEEKVKNMIMPLVLNLVYEKIGSAMKFYFPEDSEQINLSLLLDVIVKHFHLFSDFLPKFSFEKFKKIRNKHKLCSEIEFERYMKEILVLFRITDFDF
ncbi:PIN domain-containing protein [Hamiltosporidium magnivora]|uniref:PIN domain-containing protein n=1 Tax=Hamiltosporidium magnivora TaxID=148818 RepID=A0A4Q9LIT1_9MICR|nr:PIN domain-containing protein [Hamiltosporidium magnivora]